MSGEGDDDVLSFFLKPSVSPEELDQIVPVVTARLEHVLQRVEGEDDVLRFYKDCQQQEKKSPPEEMDSASIEDECVDEMEDEYQRDPRPYQQALLQRAKTENIIVHLGTGSG